MTIRFKKDRFLLLSVFPLACLGLAFSLEAVAETPIMADDKPPAQFHNDLFHAPEMIMVGQLPLNNKARQMYPSPVLFDVDRDDRVELVVGDIFGSLNVYENENPSASGDPVWSENVRLQSTDGQPIKVSNW